MPPPIFLPLVIDISHWIEVPDFRLLDPMPWLIITKATESDYYLDATYPMYADMIRDAGIRLGAYHFARPGDQVAHANFFCDYIETVGLQGNEVLAYDLETTGITLEQGRKFLDRTQDRTGIRPIIYSTELLLESLYPTPNVPPAWLKNEWLWIAEYVIPTSNEIPDWIVPAGISKSRVGLWQYSDDGEIGGIPKNNVDLNIINQTFIQYLNLKPPIPTQPPTPGESTMYEMRTISNGTRIRDQHNTGGNVLASVNGNVTVQGDELFTATVPISDYQYVGDKWLKITYAGVTGWMAYIHKGLPICNNFREIADPPPVDPPVNAYPASVTLNYADGSTKDYFPE